MSPDSLQSLLALALGFAFAGALSTGFQLATDRPATFQLIGRGPSIGAFAALSFLIFAAPFIIMRNIIYNPTVGHAFELAMLGTMFAGFWSLMSGTVVVMTLRAFVSFTL